MIKNDDFCPDYDVKKYIRKNESILKKCSHCNSIAKFYYVSSGALSDSSFYVRFRIGCSRCNIFDEFTDGIIEMSFDDNGEIIISTDTRNECIEMWNGEN